MWVCATLFMPTTLNPGLCAGGLQTPVTLISRMLGKARCLHQARAYLHQYERHGVGCAELEAAFEAADDIITKYRAM